MAFKLTTMDRFPAEANPYNHDLYHMGIQIGLNITLMFKNFEHEKCYYFIIVNTETGERIKVEVEEQHKLYENGDPDAPACIKDSNGEVVLGMCKKCKKAEAELDEPCVPKK